MKIQNGNIFCESSEIALALPQSPILGDAGLYALGAWEEGLCLLNPVSSMPSMLPL